MEGLVRRKESDVEDRRSAQYTRYSQNIVLFWVNVWGQIGENGVKIGGKYGV